VKNTDLLIEQGAKIIVVACNTATTNAIAYLRENYTIPFIGIEPAIKPAALKSTTKKIGILATKGTLNSALFANKVLKFEDTEIVEQIGEGLVPLLEEGKIDSIEMHKLLQQYLDNLMQKNIDHLVLGCSHYPFLIPQIKTIIGENITIIDSGEAVARQTKFILKEKELLNTLRNKPVHKLYSNKDASILKKFITETNNLSIKYLEF
ncbi:MAG TPA: glutamate racemase, partial [Flavobacteriia bacterium]|nr:glutamate racemase [Flavobacteriia bacterium]